MPRYSIKDLENFTQIKAHTIRIWEQRYGLLQPERTDSNIRYYSENDLKKILNIHLLYSNGVKISKIALLSELELREEVKQIIETRHEEDVPEIASLIMAVTALDTDDIHKQLSTYFDRYGIEDFYAKVVVPVLVKIGTLWQSGALSVGQEHLFSNVLRNFFIVKASSLPSPKENAKRAILFLHAREEHELSLLYYQYLLRRAGFHSFYLGVGVPMEDLRKTVEQVKPDLLVTNFISSLERDEFEAIFRELSTFFPLKNVRAGGFQLEVHKDVLPLEIGIIQSEKTLLS